MGEIIDLIETYAHAKEHRLKDEVPTQKRNCEMLVYLKNVVKLAPEY